MTIKTVCSCSCAIFCSLVMIVAIATNYWLEYTAKDSVSGTADSDFKIGLFEKCEVFKPHTKDEEDRGCQPLDMTTENFAVARMTLIGTYMIALMLTLIAFIFVTVYCSTGKYYFPVLRVAICFVLSAISMIIGLSLYTFTFRNANASFSWSYGAGWSATGMYLITTVLLFADK